MTKKLRIAWFSDYDSSGGHGETLSSYCSSLLVPRLRERFDIEVFSELKSLHIDPSITRHYLTAITRHQEQPFDLFFYQLEDHRKARFVRSHIGVMPGVLWAHDLYLSDLGAEALHTSPWEQTIRRYHNQDVTFADRTKPPHQLAPLAYREVSLNPIVLCSSQRGIDAVHRVTTDRITTNDRGDFSLGYLPIPVERTQRRRRNQNAACIHVATAASVGLEGRSHKFLQALKELKDGWRLTWLVDAAEQQRASSLLEEFQVEGQVSLVVGRTPETWSHLLDSADSALHLHNGFFGHTAPYLQISLEAGVPCITLRAIGGSDLPESAVWTVVPGHSEAKQIGDAISLIAEVGSERAGQRGQAIVQQESAVDGVADALAVTFERSAPLVAPVMERWTQLFSDAREALLAEVQSVMDDSSSNISAFQALFLPVADELGWR